jgi:hypothetical protein
MCIVRDYFGIGRTTVTYHNEILAVGGNADEFFTVTEVGKSNNVLASEYGDVFYPRVKGTSPRGLSGSRGNRRE